MLEHLVRDCIGKCVEDVFIESVLDGYNRTYALQNILIGYMLYVWYDTEIGCYRV